MVQAAKGHNSTSRSKGTARRRSACPVANTLDIVGDRWTLLVIRDLARGKRRFVEFSASPERIPTNILSDRLKRLEQEGIVTSHLYSQHPPRSEYNLTPRGEDLVPVMRSIVDWGLKHIPGTHVLPLPERARPR